MSDRWALLAGWVHYLAFDLFVGAVMAARMDRAGVGRLVQAPILLVDLHARAARLPDRRPDRAWPARRRVPTQTRSLKGAPHVLA
jgi:hypothetical protein